MRETKMENGKIQLLDCTLRDGGQGLEAAYRTEVSKHSKKYISQLSNIEHTLMIQNTKAR